MNKQESITWPTRRLCSALNLSPPQLGKLVNDGAVRGKLRHGEYDAVVAIKSYVEFLCDEIARVDKSDDQRIVEQRLRWFTIRSDRAQLELDARCALLVPAEEVERNQVSMLLILRNQLRGLPSKLAPFFDPKTPATAFVIMQREIENFLNDLADRMECAADGTMFYTKPGDDSDAQTAELEVEQPCEDITEASLERRRQGQAHDLRSDAVPAAAGKQS